MYFQFHQQVEWTQADGSVATGTIGSQPIFTKYGDIYTVRKAPTAEPVQVNARFLRIPEPRETRATYTVTRYRVTGDYETA